MKSIIPSAFLSLALLLSVPAGASDAGNFDRTVPADASGEVEIINLSGGVSVRGWDRNEVQIHAELGEDVEKLDVQSSKGRTSLNVIVRNGRHGAESDLVVEIPRNSTLLIKTVSADQVVAEMRGVQRLQAVSGSINTQVWSEEFSIKTISGEVTVQGHKAASVASVNTVSGDVELSDLAGELNLETVTGDMSVSMTTLNRGRIQTTNGDLRLQASLARDARLEAEAINGDLGFQLRQPIDAEFDIETFNGEIDNCFGPKAARSSENTPGNALRFKEGDGNARVRIKTMNGGVELCR